jgi:cytidine deaminase
MNVEVSMPTGSLCSERNAIGSALSTDPSLCRTDLRMIAVLAVGLDRYSTTSTLSAHLPVPSKLIPLLPTTPHSLIQSPTKSAFDRGGGAALVFPQLNGNDGEEEEDDASTPATMEDEAAAEEPLPAQANPALLKAQSERSVFQNHPAAAARASGGAPPSSPRTSSPRTRASASPSPQPAAAAAGELKDVKDGALSVTPRKRKASSNSLTVAEPASPSVHFAPSPSARSVSPPRHTPRLTRNATQPPPASSQDLSTRLAMSAASAAVAAVASSHSPQWPSPAMSRRSLRNGGGAAAAAGSGSPSLSSVTPVKAEEGTMTTPNTRSSKRARTSASRRATSAADNGVADSIYADGDVTDKQKADYIAHELALVAHRDAMLHANNYAARMSGNLAPGALTPTDRFPSASPPPPPSTGPVLGRTMSAGAALINAHAHASSSSASSSPNLLPHHHRIGSHHAHEAHPDSVVLSDERNPINPCGACNEWLKKIAESNPDFRVVTFTSTDCSTCFVKPVKD